MYKYPYCALLVIVLISLLLTLVQTACVAARPVNPLLLKLHVDLQRTCSLLPCTLVSPLVLSVQHQRELQQSKLQHEELQEKLLEQDAVIGDLQAQLKTHQVISSCTGMVHLSSWGLQPDLFSANAARSHTHLQKADILTY